MTKKSYPVFDHDKDGLPDINVNPGRLYKNEDGDVICSEHGDVCATDGSLVRDKSRLYRCTVCGQGTWAD